jgi:hypothetical protein
MLVPYEYEQYDHHGRKVWVRSDLKGLHREHCLCFRCQGFKPERREQNCKIANAVFEVCVQFGLCTPVFECPAFKAKDT